MAPEPGTPRNATELAEVEALSGIGSWRWDVAGDIVTWSEQLCRIFGVALEEFPATFDGFLQRLHEEDRAAARTNVERALRGGGTYDAEYRFFDATGNVRWLRCRGGAELGASGEVVRLIGTSQDVTEQKQSEAALIHRALHDDLTGLPNRSLLFDRLTHALQRTVRTGRRTAVFFIDVDGFKVVNDRAGHRAGDDALVTVAHALRQAVRQHDTVARYGGDEFVVVAEDLQWPQEADAVAGRLLQAATQGIVHGSERIPLTASIGAVLIDNEKDPEDALAAADAAMYRAKMRGGNDVELEAGDH